MKDTLFPQNPTHGMIFQQKNGVLYQYDITIRAWVKIASDSLNITLATATTDGAMSAADLKKLNQMVLPAQASSIKGNDCISPYKSGHIELKSGDDFVKIQSNAVLQNVDYKGDYITESMPYQIHQHTYGFDFGIDVSNLIEELRKRNNINLEGKPGIKGETGKRGDPGLNGILCGPAGDQGIKGSAPESNITVVPETFAAQARPGLRRALVNAKVVIDPTDDSSYELRFDRQVIGSADASASEFYVKPIESTWILATIASDSRDTTQQLECGIITGGIDGTNKYDLYYVDVADIMDTIRSKFEDEVERLKQGYEEIVRFWINTMSDLFDEQKSALTCAFEKCRSMTKSSGERKHMESVASTILGKGKMDIHGRNSNQSVKLPSSRGLVTIDQPNPCPGGPPFPERPSRFDAQSLKSSAAQNWEISIDPIAHSSSSMTAKLELPAGKYVAIIKRALASINGHHRANVRVNYIHEGTRKTADFMDKGSFNHLSDARSAYEGLTIDFTHDGGNVEWYLPSLMPKSASGHVQIEIIPYDDVAPVVPNGQELDGKDDVKQESSKDQKSKVIKKKIKQSSQSPQSSEVKQENQPANDPPKVEPVQTIIKNDAGMDIDHLRWYEVAWMERRCCGLVVNVGGQDYIIVRRGLGDDKNCGGGEIAERPIIAHFTNLIGHPSFAWPTVDGNTFAPLPNTKSVGFIYDEEFNDIVANKILAGDVRNTCGNPDGVRHLAYQLQHIVIPTM